jgi:hypothetical protein
MTGPSHPVSDVPTRIGVLASLGLPGYLRVGRSVEGSEDSEAENSWVAGSW